MKMRRAFTLVELTIVLVVVGLMAVFAMQAFSGKTGSDCYATTEEQLKTIDAALQNFIATQHRLPKPAKATLGSSATGYGYEATGSITDPLDPAYGTDVPADMTNAGGVLIGALPHMSLGLENSYSSDCWGQKFTYAVTNMLTSSDPGTGYPSDTQGTIALKGDASSTLSTAMSYVVVSHGQDKFGATAISAGNTTAKNCAGSTEPKLDVENCDNDTTFMSTTRNAGDTPNYFDDIILFKAKLQSTEDCSVQPVNWLTNCTGDAPVLVHGSQVVVNNTAPTYIGNVTVTCRDGTLIASSPSCAPGGPATCASEGLNEGEGNYDGACHLTSCCSGTIVNSTMSGPCPAAPYVAGAGNCIPTCDSDPGDGLTAGQKYCSGVVIAQGGGNFVCMGGLWGASYPFSCDASLCQSGSASTDITSETSGCPSPPDCSSGDTVPMADCSETAQCTCN